MLLGKNHHLLQKVSKSGECVFRVNLYVSKIRGDYCCRSHRNWKNTCSWFSETNVNLEKRVYVMAVNKGRITRNHVPFFDYTAIHIYINGWLQRFIGFYCIPSIMVYGYVIPVTMGILYHHRFKSFECSTAHKISRFSTLTGMAMKLHKLTSQTQICCFCWCSYWL